MQRVLAAWDEHLTHASLPRKLAPQLRAAGFEHVQMEAYPFATTELIPDAYGGSLVPLLEQYVVEQGGLSQGTPRAGPMTSASSASGGNSSSRSLSSASRQAVEASRAFNPLPSRRPSVSPPRVQMWLSLP
jgi:hypothetical protein